MSIERFTYAVTDGWLRDLASDATPNDPWPCVRWDDRLLADQIRFLDVQAGLGVAYNLVWGLFVDRAWPVPFGNIIDAERGRRLHAFVGAVHERGLKVLHGTGIYSWGFDEIIRKVPGVSAGSSQAMCLHSAEAWDWQRRVLDFLMKPEWGLDGISMQSADLGRCDCPDCARLSPAEYHAALLIRSAEHVRAARPEWVIGQASWGLRVDEPDEFKHLQRVSQVVDYMVEVQERSAWSGRRPEIVAGLSCAFGSVGGVFVEPPQHWDRLRWFVPCGLGSARALAELYRDGGRACEYFYRPFYNPVEEVSWRTGARLLSAPTTAPEVALHEALEAVYQVQDAAAEDLVALFARGEHAYFSRSDFKLGQGPLSLEPLIWKEDPAAPGPPIYLRDRMPADRRPEYARDLERLKGGFERMRPPDREAQRRTIAAIDGALHDLARLR
ncbi:MAG: hypothetical protein ABSD48_06370 [Armatimonadota bacterium]|jgi:hypothetical protein